MAGPESSKTAVITAIVGNACVMCAKFVAYFATGSGAILSEAIHTFADLLNQILLLVGIKTSANDANENYAYGYGAERYIWALISAVGIFFLGCGVTVYHGVSSLLHEHRPVGEFGWAGGVLVVSFVIEFYVLSVAVSSARRSAAGRPLFAFLRKEADPAVVAVILEDAAACLGIVIAFVAIGLTWLTGDQYWDAIGSITIGVLLGCIACWLIQRNRSLLVGESVPPHIRTQLLKILNENPTVEEVVDLRTRILDTSTFTLMARRWPDKNSMNCVLSTIRSRLSKNSNRSPYVMPTRSWICWQTKSTKLNATSGSKFPRRNTWTWRPTEFSSTPTSTSDPQQRNYPPHCQRLSLTHGTRDTMQC